MSYTESLTTFQTIDLDQMRPSGFLDEMTELIRKKHALVASKHGWKNVSACPVCENENREDEFEKFDVPVVRCISCSLRYAARIPVNTEDIYSDESYLPVARERYLENVAYRKERFGKERLRLITEQLGALSGKRLLDIGCGTGWFLEVAKEAGMEVAGQEIGKELGAWTSERLGVPVFTSSLENVARGSGFDVITMFDLLEHVEDPVALVLACKKLLRPNGIVVIFTPNFDSVALDIMKEESNLVCPTDHLTYFTQKSVIHLAARAGLSLVYYRTCGIDMGDIKSYFESKGKPHLSEACAELYDKLQPVIDQAGAGNHMRFILKRVE